MWRQIKKHASVCFSRKMSWKAVKQKRQLDYSTAKEWIVLKTFWPSPYSLPHKSKCVLTISDLTQHSIKHGNYCSLSERNVMHQLHTSKNDQSKVVGCRHLEFFKIPSHQNFNIFAETLHFNLHFTGSSGASKPQIVGFWLKLEENWPKEKLKERHTWNIWKQHEEHKEHQRLLGAPWV